MERRRWEHACPRPPPAASGTSPNHGSPPGKRWCPGFWLRPLQYCVPARRRCLEHCQIIEDLAVVCQAEPCAARHCSPRRRLCFVVCSTDRDMMAGAAAAVPWDAQHGLAGHVKNASRAACCRLQPTHQMPSREHGGELRQRRTAFGWWDRTAHRWVMAPVGGGTQWARNMSERRLQAE